MKKLLSLVIASILFLFGSSLVCFGLKKIDFSNAKIPLIIGFVIISFSIILLIVFIKTKKMFLLYLIYVFNIFSMGFFIKSWHLFKEYDFALYVLILVSLLCVVYLLVFYILSYVPLFSRHYVIFLIVYLVLSIILYIILALYTKTIFLSTYGFYMIIEIGFLFALSVGTYDYKALLEAIICSTFMVVIVGLIILILMLDLDFDFDFTFGHFNFKSPKEPERKRKFMY